AEHPAGNGQWERYRRLGVGTQRADGVGVAFDPLRAAGEPYRFAGARRLREGERGLQRDPREAV
ncbi:MAG TPA: hypothetical protein VFA16_00470, partial [Mycobacterium sp.]|uniref:hypothetical protein n=1 Tax=Mycobacterium sp. TaxID=1785 RepID=UPI002D36531D